jgi:hypothetical protein
MSSAAELGRRGWQAAADDMVVCTSACRMNLQGEEILREWSAPYEGRIDASTPVDYGELAARLAGPAPSRTAPLEGLFFLEGARATGPEFRRRPLPETELFCRLVHYGFGGLPCPEAWRHQFEVYGRLAAGTRGATLAAPEGLGRMRAALGGLEEVLDAWLRTDPRPPG